MGRKRGRWNKFLIFLFFTYISTHITDCSFIIFNTETFVCYYCTRHVLLTLKGGERMGREEREGREEIEGGRRIGKR